MTTLTRKEKFELFKSLTKLIKFIEENIPFNQSESECNFDVSDSGIVSPSDLIFHYIDFSDYKNKLLLWTRCPDDKNLGYFLEIKTSELKSSVSDSNDDELMFSLINNFDLLYNDTPAYKHPDQYKLTDLTDYINRITRI